MPNSSHITRKVCLLGRLAVGKTSLVRRFVENVFDEKYQTTVGVSIHTKTLQVDSHTVKLILWDIAGFEQVANYANYLRGSHGVLWVADGTEPASWEKLSAIRQAHSLAQGLPGICLVNKHDLLDDWRIGHDELDELRALYRTVLFTSAKTGENVEKAFTALAEQMLSGS